MNPRYLLALCFFISSPAFADSEVEDNVEQVGLSEVAEGELAALQSQLRLSPPIDVKRAFDSNNLVASVRGLAPLKVSSKSGPPPAGGGTLRKDPKAYIATATKWIVGSTSAFVNLRGQLSISVCWINPSDANTRGREITRQAVAATWEYYGALAFTGWGKCGPGSGGIRILIADQRPRSSLGSSSDSRTQSMVLNFTFGAPEMAGCQSRVELCIHSIAVHEFGHALGFLHEQDSAETPQWCKRKLGAGNIAAPLAELKAKMATDWDESSVMNYCFDIYSTRVQLSDCDIAALQAFYAKAQGNLYASTCPVLLRPM